MPIPESITSGHVTLRPFQASDLAPYLDFMTDTEATRYLLLEPEQKTEDGARALFTFVQDSYETNEPVWALAIATEADGYVGSCGVSPLRDTVSECYYTLLPKYQGRGYATRALRALLDYLFANTPLTEARAYMDPANPASAAVAARVGMTEKGMQAHPSFGNEALLYAITKEAWEARTRRPNIILIVADDMGYGDCGCFGSTAIATPRLDALAANGIRFTDFHSNGAVCSPTRAALLTGRYQQRCGIEGVLTAAGHRHTGLPLEETTFAELLRAHGYRTALFGKWHLGYERRFNPYRRGFDEFHGFVAGNVDYRSHIDQTGAEDWWVADNLTPEDGYTTDLVTENGVRFIEENHDRPFCLYLAHECPHYPYQGPSDPAYREPGNPGPPHGPRQDQAQAYREMMACMDLGIGRIADTVKSLGLERNTLIFFFSDNGPAGPGSAGPLRGGKGTVWEGGHRVPALACWPGAIPAGTETAVPCMGMDLFPTLADVAGIPVPDTLRLDGESLLPLMSDRVSKPSRTLFWRHHESNAVREGKWKLIVDGKSEAPPALFDLDTDLGESQDVAADFPEVTASLLLKLAAWEENVSQ